MSAKQTKKNSGKRVAMTVLCIVLGVILIGMLAGTIVVNHLYGKMNYVDPETEVTLSQEELDELLGTLPLDNNDAVFNFCCSMCSTYEHKAFIVGLQYGAHLIFELK